MSIEAVRHLRCLAATLPTLANSGHPGAPIGMSPAAVSIFGENMKWNPKNPQWLARDRFVLSSGHASALLYSLFYVMGHPDVSAEDLKSFRQLGSKCAGHPENDYINGIEVTTGPLGQGIANAVGLAIAEANLEARYNREGFELFNNFTYVLHGDGCIQEGVSCEAASLAGHLGLGRLICFYDDNQISIDGNTNVSFTEDVAKRYEAYGWQVLRVEEDADAENSINGYLNAIKQAQADLSRPSIIFCRTIIGFGSAKQGTAGVHGAPLSQDDLANLRKINGVEDVFAPSETVKNYWNNAAQRGADAEATWNALFQKYAETYSAEYAELQSLLNRNFTKEQIIEMCMKNAPTGAVATRKTSHICIQSLAPTFKQFIGGSADLTHSNLTDFGEADFQKGAYANRYIRFGVREHAMAAICNGIAAFNKNIFLPYCSTFCVFAGYALGAIRLSALSHLPVAYVFTHDFFLGEDGPTHQPVETIAQVSAIPNINVFRPADFKETVAAYTLAMTSTSTPTFMYLSRGNLPQLENSDVNKALMGGYIVQAEDSSKKLDAVIVAAGGEVDLAIQAAAVSGLNLRIVSMPCRQLFEKQTVEYQESVVPRRQGGVFIMSLEAGISQGWIGKFSHFHYGVETFGVSAPEKVMKEHFGFTPAKVAEKIAHFAPMNFGPVLFE